MNAIFLVLGLLFMAGTLYVVRRPAPPVAPAASPVVDWRKTAMDYRMHGRFDDAAQLLRGTYASAKDPVAWKMLLGVVEDQGDAREVVRESRDFLAAYPGDQDGEATLARGLLFEAATNPRDPSAKAWIDEAAQIAQRLEKAGYRPTEAPGAAVILRMQAAFLRQQWAEADRLAARALELGTTSGETADLISVRFDLALRDARLKDAEAYLDRAVRTVEAWPQASYYQLRTFREEAMIVREIYFGKPFTGADVGHLETLHRELRARGFVDPTLPDDGEVARAQGAMREWIAMRDRGDREGQLRMVEAQLAAQPPHKPRCFYSEAVASPFRPVYFHLLAGRLCLELKRKDEARKHFEAALESHPGDRMIQAELDKV